MTIKAIQIQFTVTPGGLIFSFTPLKKSKDIPPKLSAINSLNLQQTWFSEKITSEHVDF